jgi:hypothetical protein
MTGLGVLVVGGIVGAGIGYVIGRLPVSPVGASVGAAMLAWLVPGLIRAVVWQRRAVGESGIAAVSGGLVDSSMVAVVGIRALCVHAMLGWGCRAGAPWVVHRRPVILGVLGGILGAATLSALGT